MKLISRSALVRFWREWLRSLLVVVLVVTAFRSAIADWNDVPTGSMKPTILEGDRIVVNKLAYDLTIPYTSIRLLRWARPSRGDIVVLWSPEDGRRLVKRVIGVPGDTIALQTNRLVVNGETVPYSAHEIVAEPISELPSLVAMEQLVEAPHRVMLMPGGSAAQTFGPIVVPADRYFLMGDNRDRSLDSRHFGMVEGDAIIGRAAAVAASVDPQRHYLPRWSRWFSALD
jgi:signal peptidase I